MLSVIETANFHLNIVSLSFHFVVKHFHLLGLFISASSLLMVLRYSQGLMIPQSGAGTFLVGRKYNSFKSLRIMSVVEMLTNPVETLYLQVRIKFFLQIALKRKIVLLHTVLFVYQILENFY